MTTATEIVLLVAFALLAFKTLNNWSVTARELYVDAVIALACLAAVCGLEVFS